MISRLFGRKKNKPEINEASDDWVEIEASSKNDAIERACIALNTTRAFLKYEVLNDSGRKIRARKIEATEQPKAAESAETPAFEKEASSLSKALKPKKLKSKEDLQSGDEAVGNEDEGRKIDNKKYSAKPFKSEDEETSEEEVIDNTELGPKAKQYLEEILGFIEKGTQVEVKETKDEINLNILGEGSGVFIGKHGQTLEAFQHVVAKMLGLDRNSQKRLTLDAEGYRSRRQESLEQLAQNLARKAQRERRAVSLEPMSAMDRRVIHMALADNKYVSTKSVGEGLNRKIVVVPNSGAREDREGSREGNGYSGRGRGNFSRDRFNRNDRYSNNDRTGRTEGRESFGNREESFGNERPSFNRSDRNERPSRQRNEPSEQDRGARGKPKLLTKARMHDSFDVPPAPKMDLFPDDIDELMDLPPDQMNERLAALEVKPKGSKLVKKTKKIKDEE